MTLRPTSPLLLAAASLFVATGCGAWKVQLRHDELVPQAQFGWQDGRAPAQRGSGGESYFISSCAYGIIRLGDDKFTPDRVAVLKSDLERALGTQLAGTLVVLKAYTVHFNAAQYLRNRDTSTGLIPALLNDKSVRGCAPDDLRGGYVANEAKTPYSPLVVVIDLEIDGRKIHARWVESAPAEMSSSRPDWSDWVSGALKSATAKAIENVRAALAATT